ncbi:MAG: response regulator, partial [Paenibacillus sp.]|nr:response regulator [Paenibacillus sp.]
MRVLIVDDEILVRVGLKTIIPWDKYGFELVGEASDGQEAIEMMERIPCDIVLTDIRMPRVDGLELIKLVKRRWPYTKCIILSSHSDFEYVQKALRIGAVDYLLKLTMEPQELVEKLLRIEKEIIRDLDKESENMQLKSKAMRYSIEVKEKRVRDILLKQCSKKEIAEVWEEFNLPSMKEAIVVANIQIDHYDQVLEENKFQSERLLNYTVANILSEILKKHDGGELVAVDHGVFSVIKEGMNYEMLGEMIRAVGSFIKLSITVGVSEPLDLIQGLNKAYQQADVALSYKFYEGCGQILSYDQVSYVPDNQLVLLWDEDIWIKMIERRDIYALLKGLEEMMTVCYGTIRTKPELMREQWFQLVNLFARYLPLKSSDIYSIPLFENQYPYHVIRNSETLTDIYDWFKGWIPL